MAIFDNLLNDDELALRTIPVGSWHSPIVTASPSPLVTSSFFGVQVIFFAALSPVQVTFFPATWTSGAVSKASLTVIVKFPFSSSSIVISGVFEVAEAIVQQVPV